MASTYHPTALKHLKRLSEVLELIAGVPCVTAGIVMTAVVLVGTTFRYLTNISAPWTEELARYLLIWMGFMGVSIALKQDGHPGVTFVVEKLPRSLFVAARVLVAIMASCFLLVLVAAGFSLAASGWGQVSPAMRVSMFWPLLALPVAGMLTLLQLLTKTIVWLIEGASEP